MQNRKYGFSRARRVIHQTACKVHNAPKLSGGIMLMGVGPVEKGELARGEEAPLSEAQERNKVLVRRFLEAQAKRDLDAVKEMMATDFVDHNLRAGQKPDREGYLRVVAEEQVPSTTSATSSRIKSPKTIR